MLLYILTYHSVLLIPLHHITVLQRCSEKWVSIFDFTDNPSTEIGVIENMKNPQRGLMETEGETSFIADELPEYLGQRLQYISEW